MSTMRDGWLDGHLLACPRVCAWTGIARPTRMVHLEKLSLAAVNTNPDWSSLGGSRVYSPDLHKVIGSVQELTVSSSLTRKLSEGRGMVLTCKSAPPKLGGTLARLTLSGEPPSSIGGTVVA